MTTRIFPGRYESLSGIAEFVRTEASLAGLTPKEVFEIETAVDEAVSNIIEHAYGGEGIGDITCSCHTEVNGVTVILEDNGVPFDPQCIPIPDIHARLKNRPTHGLGYFLMCKLMDDIHFEFNGERNQLSMFKRRQE